MAAAIKVWAWDSVNSIWVKVRVTASGYVMIKKG